MPDTRNIFTKIRKITDKAKAKAKKPKRTAGRFRVLDSDDIQPDSEADSETEDDDDDDDEMSDFIVQSDEDEEEKDARRKLKKQLGKRKAIIVDSDDDIEEDSPEEREIIFGKKIAVSKEAIKLMPRFLPSTKMKVCDHGYTTVGHDD
jgi:hypothetical protein